MNQVDVTNPAVIQTMYNNFVKITDWIIKGSESAYPMPGALAEAADRLELVGDALAAVTALQDTVRAQKEALDKHAATINALIAEVNRLAEVQAAQGAPEQPQQEQPAPQQEQPQALVGELVDLGEAVQTETPKRRSRKKEKDEQITLVPEQQSAPAAQQSPVPAEQIARSTRPEPVTVDDDLQILAARVDAGDLNPAALEQLTAQVAQLLRG